MNGSVAGGWADAVLAARLFCIDPFGLGGILVRARVGPVRRAWTERLQALLHGRPVRRLPLHASEDRIIGGLDLAATLERGRLIIDRGVLAEADGGVVLVPMAERMNRLMAAYLSMALDDGVVVLERDGLTDRMPARVGAVLFDEGIGDERAPAPIVDRVAIHIDLDRLRHTDIVEISDADEQPPAQSERPPVRVETEVLEAICGTAAALGIDSMRAPLFALHVARLSAMLEGRRSIEAVDLEIAARLVLGPRATRLPAEPDPPEPPPDEPPPPDESAAEEPRDEDEIGGPLDDIVLAAAQSALPSDLLAQLAIESKARAAARTSGTAGAAKIDKKRGRPAGSRKGHPRSGARLNLVETLRAAAPWQRIRRASAGRIAVRQDDFRVNRYKRRTETLTIFAVDASGSAALQRLAEAKGAVEQVLAECYVRRDQVAMIAFRGQEAELVVPPTRSLVRTKRCLASMAGGGTTPLAAGLESARLLAEDALRRGQSPLVVVMTDGRANIARDGAPDRSRARADALTAARALRAAEVPVLFVDTAPRPRPEASELSAAMSGRYIHLPYVDSSRAIAGWVQGAGSGA